MNQLPSNIKINVLKGLGKKLLKSPALKTKLEKPVTARVQKEVNPDYFSKRKTSLTGKLF